MTMGICLLDNGDGNVFLLWKGWGQQKARPEFEEKMQKRESRASETFLLVELLENVGFIGNFEGLTWVRRSVFSIPQ